MAIRKQRPYWLYVGRRIAQAIPLVIAVLVINFMLIHLAPGDPIEMLIGPEAVYDPETLDRLRASYGLDRPTHEQLMIYFQKMLQGDLGYSISYGLPVSRLIAERTPSTAVLIAASILFSATLGVLLGILSSSKPYSLVDNLTTTLSLVAYSLPNFWLGQVLLIVFAVRLGILPAGGFVTAGADYGLLESLLSKLRHLILPVLALGTSRLALITRLTRASMLETLDQDYIVTARAKGVPKKHVLRRHAFRNACLPVVTIVGLEFGFIFAGAVVTETVFAWPGLGRLMFESIKRRDYPLLMGMFFVVSVSVIAANLLIDLIYTRLDPRIIHR